LRERIIQQILHVSLADNTNAWELQPDSSYRRTRPVRAGRARRSQAELIELARAPEASRGKSARGAGKFPQVKLAPSPFGPRKARGNLRGAG